MIKRHDATSNHGRFGDERFNHAIGLHLNPKGFVRWRNQFVKSPVGTHMQGNIIRNRINRPGNICINLCRKATRDVILVRQTHSDNNRMANFGSNRLDHFKHEPHSILKTAPIFVRSLIQRRREKLVYQITTGSMNINAIKAAVPDSSRSQGKRSNDIVNHGLGHLNRHDSSHGIRHSTR